jgi:hypothetical protein
MKRIVGVVLAGQAFAAVGAHQLRGDDARIQAEPDELARPVVRAGARLHGDDATRRQPDTPFEELVPGQCAAGENTATRIHRMHLDHALGQADPYSNSSTSCNLLHGLPPSMA